ncbi:MAG TPA: TIM barrel protein, partial [Candidatus Eisenbacteria bacterium]|nr:TIM barrel protein [Candidatus Eisenbacteria bacterium]
MNLKLSCADFSFPLLLHEAALNLISVLGLRGIDIGLFAGRSHLRPETELRQPKKNGERLRRRLAKYGLAAADIFLQVHENFRDFAINHPEPSRRNFAREQFVRALDYAAAAGSKHLTILPGVSFKNESRAASLACAADELSWRVEKAATTKLAAGIEPHLGSIVDTPERALALAANVPNLGFTLDYA